MKMTLVALIVSAGLCAFQVQAQESSPVAAPVSQIAPVSQKLDERQQAIILIASFMAASEMPRLNLALEQGLDAGLSISEAQEILVQLYAYAGFPKSLNALGELLKVVESRRARGLHDAPGRGPSEPVPVGEELRAIGTANQTRIAGRPVKNAVTDFAPVINEFLQTHLFGDIFARDVINWQSRELATVGALAAMPGVEAQLRSHLNASQRVGLTVTQLQHVVQTLIEHGDPQAGERARAALHQVLSTPP